MKKTTIFTLILLFVIGFVIVGYFGMDVRVVNPIIYVDEIIWHTEDLKASNPKFQIYEFDTPNEITGANAQFEYFCRKDDLPLKINIKCEAKPVEATNTLLDYTLTDAKNSTIEVKNDNSCDVTFTSKDSPKLIITSNDVENAQYIIQFLIVSI